MRTDTLSADASIPALEKRVRDLESALVLERQLRRQEKKAITEREKRLARVPSPANPVQDDTTGGEKTQYIPSAIRSSSRAGNTPPPPPSDAEPSLVWPPPKGTPLALPVGFRLHEYRIDSVLGQGGFGITYLASDVNLNVNVAIKEYLPADVADRATDKSVHPRSELDMEFYQAWLDSFLVEARTLATFRHPNIVRVARFFEANHTAYMVLDYERGRPLKTWWPKHKNLPESDLVALLQPLLDGLALVHEAGYLHRDIKPDNIYVRREDGSLVLLDFGSAKRTGGGTEETDSVFTPGYAPIEQYGGNDQGPWTDIYAFGATLYWMISGKKPTPAPMREGGDEPQPSAEEAGRGHYSVEFLRAIDWAMQLEPKDRPQNVQAFRQMLFAAHAGSFGLQEALSLREAEKPMVVESLQTLRDVPSLVQRRISNMWRDLARPGSWRMAVKMTLAMVFAALVPMLITAYYNLNAGVDSTAAAELRNLERIAQSTAGRVAQLVADNRHLADFLGTDEDFIEILRQPSPALTTSVNAKLQNMEKTNPDTDLLMLMNAEGTAVLSSDPGVTGRNLKFRQYFKEAMAGHSYMTSVVVGASAGLPGVYYSKPVFNAEHKAIGAVVLRIKGSTIAGILDPVGGSSGIVPFMIDGDGVLVEYPDKSKLYRSLMPLPKEKVAEIISDQRFRRDHIDSMNIPGLAQSMVGAKAAGNISYFSPLSGAEEIAGYAPVQGSNWVVGITESRAQFEAPLHQLFNNVLYSVVLVGLIFVVFAILFARSFVRPITRLTDAAEALKAGDYDKANVTVTSTDELGKLARTFNVMIDVLRQRDRERKAARRGKQASGAVQK